MMKKFFLLMLTLMLTLCAASALADTVPEEIADLFDVKAWEGYEVARTNTEEEGYACFLCDEDAIIDGQPVGLVIVSKGDHNVLCLVQKRSGQWRITGRNHNAIPDGDIIPALYFDLQDDIDIVYGNNPLQGVISISLKYDGRNVSFDGVVFEDLPDDKKKDPDDDDFDDDDDDVDVEADDETEELYDEDDQ